jgi:hypothetical protein
MGSTGAAKIPKPCKTRATLSAAWSAATRDFSDATNVLTGDQIGTMSTPAYQALRAKAEQARLISENARIALNLHRQEHGC